MAGVLLLLLWPIWEFQYSSQVDYPGHLARVEILRDWSHETLLRQRYDVNWRPYPNLAFDLLAGYAFAWLDVPTAGKVSESLLLILFWAGCHFLGCAAGRGRPVWLAVVAPFLVYNSQFLYGFVNYNFGIALFLLALPTWLWYRRKRSVLSFAAAALLATAAYIAHLTGIGVLAVSMIFLTLWEWRKTRRWHNVFAIDLLPLAPAVALYASLGRYRGDTQTIVWGSWALKARHMVVWITSYNAWLTVLYAAVWTIALAILFWKGRKWAGSGLLALAGMLGFLAVVFPAEQLFSGGDPDARIVIPAVALTLLALTVEAPVLWGRVAFLLVLGTMCMRMVEIRHYWRAGDALTRTQIDLLRPLPRGAAVFPIMWLPDGAEEAKRERHLWHALEYATVDNLIFFPQFFDVVGQQPVTVRGAYAHSVPGISAEAISWPTVFREFDFIYTYGVDGTFQRQLDGHTDQAGLAGKGKLYRVRREAL